MKKIIFITSFLLITGTSIFAQYDAQMWIKLSPELRLNFGDTPFEVRWRPDDHIFLPGLNVARTDIMLGANIWKFKLFSYSKFDALEGYWTGARLDFNLDFFNKKLLLNLQTRYFFGLNDVSADHYYLIEYLRFAVTKNIHLGVLSYGKWKIGEPFDEAHWFVGPSVFLSTPSKLSINFVVTKDIFSQDIYMTYVRLGYKIKFKRKKKE